MTGTFSPAAYASVGSETGSVFPVVHGDRRRLKWLLSLGLFATGSTLSGGLLGIAVCFLGGSLEGLLGIATRRGLLASFAAAYALHEFGVIVLPRPQFRWQVPQNWRSRFPLPVTGLLYGLLLGFGCLTYIPVSTYYICVLWCGMLAQPLSGAAVLATYGLAEVLPILISGWRVGSWDEAYCKNIDSLRLRDWLHRANAIVLVACATFIAVSLT